LNDAAVTLLLEFLDDNDVALHAMSALQRVIGAADALPHIEATAERHRGTPLGDTAIREARRMRKAVVR
jgi:hypothetical protein